MGPDLCEMYRVSFDSFHWFICRQVKYKNIKLQSVRQQSISNELTENPPMCYYGDTMSQIKNRDLQCTPDNNRPCTLKVLALNLS